MKTVQSNFGNSIYLTELEEEAQETFHVFYAESFGGSSKIENLVILNACYLHIYSLARANELSTSTLRGVIETEGLEAGCNYQG